MPYVQRDLTGLIVGLFSEPRDVAREWVETDSAEMRAFVLSLKGDGPAGVLDKLAGTDQSIIRVLEDLVDTLISKNHIHFTDLPDAAQAKLLERRSLRSSVNSLHLFSDADQKLI
jgi:hypothetical protein